MSETSFDKHTETRWLTYLKALIFLFPAVIAWGFTCVFILPKLKESFEIAGLDLSTQGWLWTTPSVLILLLEHSLFVCIVLFVTFILLESFFRRWIPYRRITLGALVWVVNVAVLVAVTDLLILATIAAPGQMQVQ